MYGVYQLEKIIKDTALMVDDYRCFLINVRTNKIIGKLENEEFLYDKNEIIIKDNFYFLGKKGLTSIYDAEKEQFVLQDCRRRYQKKDYYFMEVINLYNGLLEEASKKYNYVEYCDITFLKDYCAPMDFHPNTTGNKFIAELLLKKIEQEINKDSQLGSNDPLLGLKLR